MKIILVWGKVSAENRKQKILQFTMSDLDLQGLTLANRMQQDFDQNQKEEQD